MWVTAYTDAGFKDGKGTWGIWVRSGEGRIIRKGNCPSTITDANEAEMYAILVAIRAVTASWPKAEGILVKSDSKTALGWSRYNAPGPRKDTPRRLRAKIYEFLGERKIRCVWVKAHQGNRTTQSYLNNRCDALATAARDI